MALPAFLVGLLPKLKVAGIAAAGFVVVAAGLYVWWLRDANAALEDELAAERHATEIARQAAADNLAAFEAARAESRRLAEVQARQARLLAERTAMITRLKTRTEDAPDSDDGPVAPVLGRVLDGLRLQHAHGAGADGAGGAPGHPGGPADLSPRPDGS